MAITQTVTGPTRTDRTGGVETVAEFEDTDRLGYTETLSWVSDPCTFPKNAIGLCWEDPEADDAKSGESVDIETAIGSPFALYGGVECWLGPDGDFDERARAILDQGTGRAIEARIAAWAAGGTALAESGDLVQALAAVDNDLDDGYVGRGVIFLNRGDAVLLDAAGALQRTLSGIETINGTPVVSTSKVPAGTIYSLGAIKVLQTAIIAHNVTHHTTNVEMSIAERVNAILVDCSYRVAATVATP